METPLSWTFVRRWSSRRATFAGARSIPVAELRTRIREVPKRRVIVAYCRGPYCVFADQAVGILRDAGYKALRLDGGFPEWQMKGMPVERGAVEMAGNR